MKLPIYEGVAGCLGVLASGSEMPDMWKAITGLGGIVLMGVTIYKMMSKRVADLEVTVKKLEKLKEVKTDQYTEAIKEAARFQALYESLKERTNAKNGEVF